MTADDAGDIRRLLDLMAILRDPAAGCPWDRAQTFATIAPYTVEEAYEVAEAIRQNDLAALRDELGDLLFQVVFHSRMAEETGAFGFTDVVAAICDKMVSRHPHVFGDAEARDAAGHPGAWEEHKARERAERAAASGRQPSVLDGVAVALPALARAIKLQGRVVRVGFDWPGVAPVLDKLQEEIGEVRQEIASGDRQRLEDEIGDVLFVVANLARHLKVDPEVALARTNAKFERRFREVEARLAARGRTPAQSDLAEMDALWEDIKADERAGRFSR